MRKFVCLDLAPSRVGNCHNKSFLVRTRRPKVKQNVSGIFVRSSQANHAENKHDSAEYYPYGSANVHGLPETQSVSNTFLDLYFSSGEEIEQVGLRENFSVGRTAVISDPVSSGFVNPEVPLCCSIMRGRLAVLSTSIS